MEAFPRSRKLTTAPESLNMDLLPKDRHDNKAVEHLKSLDPAIWTPYILCGHNTPDPYARYALDKYQEGLLFWFQDINWPVAKAVRGLFLTVINVPENRDPHGLFLLDKVGQLMRESVDWTWIAWTVDWLLHDVEDKVWVRSVLGGDLMALWRRVPQQHAEEWDFKVNLGEILGVELEERDRVEHSDKTKS